MTKFFEQEYASIFYDETIQAMILCWKVAITSGEYRDTLNILLSGMEQYHSSRVIVDTTHLGTIHPDDQEWSISDWTRRAMQIGYTHLAIILPDDVFTQVSVEDTMSLMKDQTFQSHYFDSVDEAKDWIRQ
jgi:hypothetical protein